MLVFGWLRFGALMNFVSHTVVVGFTAGAAILICTSQFRNFFGLDIPVGSKLPQVLSYFSTHIGEINIFIMGVAIVTLLGSLLVQKYLKRFPHMITALLIGSALTATLNTWLGSTHTGIRMFTELPHGFPPLSRPDLSIETVSQLMPIALAIAMLSLVEALSIARALALKTGQRIDSNQEFIGQGLSNAVGAFFSSYPSSGSFNRSGLYLEVGAQTPLAAVFSALFLLTIMQVFAPLAKYLPLSAMAGVLFLVAWKLIDFHHIAHILRSSRQESLVLVVTLLSTLFLHLEFAIYVGVLLSFFLYLKRTSNPPLVDIKPAIASPHHFAANTGLPDCPQLKILRVDGSLFFGAVDHVQQALIEVDTRNPSQKHVLLVCQGVNFIDLAGSHLLVQEARRRRRFGGDIYLFYVKETPSQTLKKNGCEEILGSDHIFSPNDVSDPVEVVFHKLDHKLCLACSQRIFRQCASIACTVSEKTSRPSALGSREVD
jgi:SulP family sulfate permease